MFTIFIRAVILYCVMLLVLRGMGKRQQGQFQPYEFAVALIMADLLATPMSDVSTPLLHGVLPVAALFILHGMISMLNLKSDKLRAFISGKPSLVLSRGAVDRKELNRLCLSMSDLLEGLRESGILDPAEAGTAVVEADGSITAFPHVAHRPVSVKDMQLEPGYEGMPMTLVLDGRLQKNNLNVTGRDEKWLRGLLRKYGLDIEGVLLASLNTQGLMHVQDNAGTILCLKAMEPEQVGW